MTWIRGLGLAAVLVATTAHAENRRVWGGSQMFEVPPEDEGPVKWTVTGTVVDFAYDRQLVSWVPLDRLTWPAAPSLRDRAIAVGSSVELVSIRCFVDHRLGDVRCEDGREAMPSLLLASFTSIRSDVPDPLDVCFDVHRVAAPAAAIARARALLVKGRPLDAKSFDLGSRLLRIDVHRRWFVRTPVEVDGQKIVDVEERIDTSSLDASPRAVAKVTSLLRIVPVTEQRDPEPGFAALMMWTEWFPGKAQYVARRLARVDATGLPHSLQTVLAYDLAVEALATGDTATGRVALDRLDGLVAEEPVAHLRELVARGVRDLRALADGERIFYEPCTGAVHR